MMFFRKVEMYWFLHAENPKKELIVLCPAYLDITDGDLLYFHEIFNGKFDDPPPPLIFYQFAKRVLNIANWYNI